MDAVLVDLARRGLFDLSRVPNEADELVRGFGES